MSLISCICMYHGRNWCLCEAVESFVRQDYKDRELVIVNDCQEQELSCDCKGVRVVNLRSAFTDLSAKQNFSVSLARSETVILWDDDDISLPWRLSVMSREMQDFQAVASLTAWYSEQNRIVNASGNLYAGSMMFSRRYYAESGGAAMNCPPDRSAWEAMARLGSVNPVLHPLQEIPYIYRWSGTGVHDSEIAFKHAESRQSRFHASVISDKRFIRGRYKIKPYWLRDYVADAREAIRKELPTL